MPIKENWFEAAKVAGANLWPAGWKADSLEDFEMPFNALNIMHLARYRKLDNNTLNVYYGGGSIGTRRRTQQSSNHP